MLGLPITYTDFEGQERTETFWFHISKPELIEMEVELDGGLGAFIKRISETQNGRELIKQFKTIILMAYGERYDDNKRFRKNDTLKEEFAQHAAYHKLFMDLATDAAKAANFLKEVLPKDLFEGVDVEAKLKEIEAESAAAKTI
jgi:hypothetical protein